jgi:UDP-GlcNAc:undecaprenyl-phosphate/decaprenyl-phosphate GlcNAc-1-phosphate transferase
MGHFKYSSSQRKLSGPPIVGGGRNHILHRPAALGVTKRRSEVTAHLPYKPRLSAVMLDVILTAMAYYGAYVLRWDADLPSEQVAMFAHTLPLVIVVQLLCFLMWGVYRGLWRYVGIDDLLILAKAVLTGVMLSELAILAIYGLQGPSRAVLILFAMLLLACVGGIRLAFRLLRELIMGHASGHPAAIAVLIYGAGDAGETLIREIRSHASRFYAPVGFIDDDDRKAGRLMHGYRIFGSCDLPQLIHRHRVREVLISSAKIPDHKLEGLRHLGVTLKRVRFQSE